MLKKTKLALLLAACVTALALLGGVAQASPGAYKVLLTEPYPEGPRTLGAQLEAFPEIVQIDYADTGVETPTVEKLSRYDLVVSVGDSNYESEEGWGNALAEYVQGGGFLFQAGYDSWKSVYLGRLQTEGLEPFVPGENVNDVVTLGEYDAASPLMAGVTQLQTEDDTAPALAAGATGVAKWSTGANAVAIKGHVVATSAWIGDRFGSSLWSGDFGRLVFNTIHTLDPVPTPVTPAAPAIPATPATTPVTTPVVPTNPTAAPTPDPSNLLWVGKITHDLKHGSATVLVTLASPGTVALAGEGTRPATASAATANEVVKLIVKPSAEGQKELQKSGTVTVGAALTFTPTGGTAASKTKRMKLRLKLG